MGLKPSNFSHDFVLTQQVFYALSALFCLCRLHGMVTSMTEVVGNCPYDFCVDSAQVFLALSALCVYLF